MFLVFLFWLNFLDKDDQNDFVLLFGWVQVSSIVVIHFVLVYLWLRQQSLCRISCGGLESLLRRTWGTGLCRLAVWACTHYLGLVLAALGLKVANALLTFMHGLSIMLRTAGWISELIISFVWNNWIPDNQINALCYFLTTFLHIFAYVRSFHLCDIIQPRHLMTLQHPHFVI